MNFERLIFNNLTDWKKQTHRTPLILKGARQTGKTYVIREFGKTYKNFHEFNFQKEPSLSNFFKKTNDPNKILEYLAIHQEKPIDIINDLVFFDEVQDCPEALNSLKFFAEEFPFAHLISAGSLLGIYLSQHTFPVGKVQFLSLYPLSFQEFLKAIGNTNLSLMLNSLNEDSFAFHEALIDELKKYYILGGMPKVLDVYLQTKDVLSARNVQNDLLTSYRADFAKYSGSTDALKILSVFGSVPKQLSKDNKKFGFNLLKKGGRFSEFNSAIDWLEHAGICHKIPIIHHAEIPLKVHVEENIFKLYFMDVGLLGALEELPLSIFLQSENIFKTFKGAFVENFFVQEFRANRTESLYCWQGKTSEVDFLFSKDMDLYPIEVKAGESGKLKSLNVFIEKYPSPWRTRCSLSNLEIRTDSKFRNIPLYLTARV